jgi:hypothetical protein
VRLPKMSSGQVKGSICRVPGVVALADYVGVVAVEAVTAG